MLLAGWKKFVISVGCFCLQASGRLVSLQPGEWAPAPRRQSQSRGYGGRATKPRFTGNGSCFSSISALQRTLLRADGTFICSKDCVCSASRSLKYQFPDFYRMVLILLHRNKNKLPHLCYKYNIDALNSWVKVGWNITHCFPNRLIV